MKRNDVFTFTAPNGVEVIAVVLSVLFVNYRSGHVYYSEYLCYAQNRLIVIHEDKQSVLTLKETIADYAILPDYDAALRESELLNKWENETI